MLIGRLFGGLTAGVAALIVAAVVVDRLRLPVDALHAGGLAFALIAVPAVLARRDGQSQPRRAPRVDWRVELTLAGVAAAFAWRLFSPAWPALLPIGNSPDAVHHAALANYIFEHRQLVRDSRAVAVALREFADYPPGFAVLAALAAETWGTLPIWVIYPLTTLTVIAGVLAVALLIVETAPPRVRPLAGLAPLALLFMPDYTLGAVANESYYAQMLAQWLILAAAVVLARQIRRPSAWRWVELILLLLALTFTYTPWLPVALLATLLGLVAQRAPWRHKLVAAGAVVLPIAAVALIYSAARTATGRAVVLIEGSTIRDPLRATGLILPGLALAGFALGWRRPARRVGAALIIAAVLQVAGLWVLWQRGQIAGYTYYKGYYLLALVMVVPIGWLLADGAYTLLRRWPGHWRTWKRLQPALALLLTVGAALMAPALPSLAQAAAYPLSPALVETGLWMRAHGLAEDVEYALRRPGLPAYWLRVGVLNQPRTDAAQALLRESRPSFLLWYLDPFAPRRLLLEQPAPPDVRDGLVVRFQNACCVVLEKTSDYSAALRQLRPLTVRYRTDFVGDKYQIDMQLYDQTNQANLRVRLVVRDGNQAFGAYTLDVPRRPDRTQFLGFALDPRQLNSAGYANQEGFSWTPQAAPARYQVLLQLLLGDTVVRESIIGTCCSAAGRWELAQPQGEWLYFQPPPRKIAPRPPELGLGLGELVDLEGSSVDRVVARLGETVTVRVRWRVRQATGRRYMTFVHLIAADGGAALSVEGEPNGGMAPAWRWQAGDRIDDTWKLQLPPRLRPGKYQVVVGMYDPSTGRRLEGWRRQPYLERFWTDVLTLGTIEVRR